MKLYEKMKYIYDNVYVTICYKYIDYIEYDKNIDDVLILFKDNVILIVNYKNEIELKIDDEFIDDDIKEYEKIIDEIIDEYHDLKKGMI